jgi:hypothetical protein
MLSHRNRYAVPVFSLHGHGSAFTRPTTYYREWTGSNSPLARKNYGGILPLSRFPEGESRGGGGEPPRRKKGRLPPTRGFSKRFTENPLVIPRSKLHLTARAENAFVPRT